MQLRLQMKLLPSKKQAGFLGQTSGQANACCNSISEIAWNKKGFPRFRLHREVYHSHRRMFNLSAQVVVSCIGKVADAYKVDRKTKRSFRPKGSIAYDNRILSFKDGRVSIWSVEGRLSMPIACH